MTQTAARASHRVDPLPYEAFASLLTADEQRAIAVYVSGGPESWKIRPPGDSPALLVVDVQNNVVGPDVPIDEAVLESRITIGAAAHRAMPWIVELLTAARLDERPVYFTKIVPEGRDGAEAPLQLERRLDVRPDETVIEKRAASAFFATDLERRLRDDEVDTLVLAGCTTSGCIRATAVDAHQLGFSVLLADAAVFDRVDLSHRVALFDLWLKYAVVTTTGEAAAYLADRHAPTPERASGPGDAR